MNDFAHVKRKTVVECRGVWKIFGNQSSAAIEAARSGRYDKDQLLKQHGCVAAVANASFSVGEGETFCIIGLSGSGKSTLIRHFNRLIEPTSGEVVVRGKDICKLKPADLRDLRSRCIGMVFQQVALLPYRTVLQNVMLPLEVQGGDSAERRAKSQAALDTVGLGNWADRYPRELSGGMQQRVGIARALAANPDVLLMDEPFSALDPLIRKQLQIEFKQLSTKLRKTTIFITHDIEEAIRIGDRIAIMREGRIIQIGTPEEIALKPADDYVASFMEGVSRLKLVKAHSIMEPIMADVLETAVGPTTVADYVSVDINADLEEMIDVAITKCSEKLAIERDGRIVGTVSRETLLRAVRAAE
ncbi:glycine/betaine ABC transporter [Burkholderia sp. A9]|nr:glycine/betaine ABC transporter [Burkholderia sp. A9]